jgi:small-conductance mechanosensitive channel
VPDAIQGARDFAASTFGQPVVNIGEGLVAFVLIWLLARLARNVVGRELSRHGVRTDAVLLATRAIYFGLIAFAVFQFITIALGQALVSLTGFLIAAVLTSLGLQDLFKNYVSGFYVLMEKNVRVGDLVETGGYRGIVTDVRMRVTYLRGAAGEMIVVPNSELFTKTLTVSAAPPGWGSGTEGAQHDPD